MYSFTNKITLYMSLGFTNKNILNFKCGGKWEIRITKN